MNGVEATARIAANKTNLMDFFTELVVEDLTAPNAEVVFVFEIVVTEIIIGAVVLIDGSAAVVRTINIQWIGRVIITRAAGISCD